MNDQRPARTERPSETHEDTLPNAAHAPGASKGVILIADDTPMDVDLLSKILIKQGYQVHAVTEGTRVLPAVRAIFPDLVLLDIMMPGMDGYEICQRLKADEQTRDIPVIFISALNAMEDKVRAFACGGVDYITKPFRVGEVLARAETHLALRDARQHLAERNVQLEQEVTERKRAETAERAVRELAEARTVELDILRNVVETLNQALTLDKVARSGLETVLASLGVPTGWILLVDERTGLRLEACNLPPVVQDDYDVELVCSPCPSLARLLAGDLTEPTLNTECQLLRSIQSHAPTSAESAVDNVTLVPLHLGKRILGALHLAIPSKADLTGDDRRLLTIIGNQYSAAIERARLFDDVQRLAITDSLTGLFTRRHFWTLAYREFGQACRHGHALSVIMLDIDHFKRVNDGYGHMVGDRALQIVAERCQAALREGDVLARYGGEEFVILLPETDLAQACYVAEGLRRRIAQVPIDVGEGSLSLTVSLGIASLEGREALALEKLIDRADQALYVAKRKGRDQIAAWEQSVEGP